MPAIAKLGAHFFVKLHTVSEQWRALFGPDVLIELGALAGAKWQNNEIEQQRPADRVNIDDSRIA